MDKKNRGICLFLLLLSGLTAGCTHSFIKAEPNQKEIRIGSGPKEIRLSAPSDKKDAKLTWHLNGPGELTGNINAPRIIYKVPDKTDQKISEAHIRLIADGAEKDQPEAYDIWFRLISPTASDDGNSLDSYESKAFGVQIELGEFIRIKRSFERYSHELEQTSSASKRRTLISKIDGIADQCYENYIYKEFQSSGKTSETDYKSLYRNIEIFLLPVLEDQLKVSVNKYHSLITELGHSLKEKNTDLSPDTDPFENLSDAERQKLAAYAKDILGLMKNILKLYEREFSPIPDIENLRENLKKDIGAYKNILKKLT